MSEKQLSAKVRYIETELPEPVGVDQLLGIDQTIISGSKTEHRMQLYIKALLDGALTKKDACKVAGISPSAPCRWRQLYPHFAQAETEALDVGSTGAMESEAARRGVEGVDKGIYHRGELVATEKVYSDNLLMFMLKGRKPDTYRDANVKHSGTVAHAHVDVGQLTDEQRQALVRALGAVGALESDSSLEVDYEDVTDDP